ncbi:cupin-like domain-containing protein [Streptomyces sp. NPDC050617]|uniref:cupin-like domain-containing protein n=1 Tax=Streptomyces sp. NPDC050617 TaxID=3154628 RepID=UPI00342283F0
MTGREAARVDVLPVRGGTDGRPMLGETPLLITGVAARWACCTDWGLASLTERMGDVEVAPFVTGEAARNTVLKQVNATKTMTFGDALAHLFGERRIVDGSLYLRIGAAERGYEELARDFTVPDVGAAYRPEATGVWFSQAGNVTPGHHDWWHSFLIQVRGAKRYTLVHPLDTVNLQSAWQDDERYDLAPAPGLSLAAQPDWSGEVRYEGVLSAGEILYIPPFWVHEVETLTDGNISIPMRFSTTQSVSSDLHQLSQNGLLRDVTNRPTRDVGAITELLRRNREDFLARERAFVRVLAEARDIDIDIDLAADLAADLDTDLAKDLDTDLDTGIDTGIDTDLDTGSGADRRPADPRYDGGATR